ncbi:MAG TPA: hypothetical protein VFT62_05480 [Mycobacteriales bacterium]|nr:hypothetical protein [Mycobacteriales bacterium]
MNRRWLTALALLGIVLSSGAACQSGVAERSDRLPVRPTAVAAVPADFPMPIVRPPRQLAPAPATLPDGTRRLLPAHRVVAFYGAAGTPTLGVLGTGTPEGVWPALARQARPYRAAHARVLPAYELIAFVATRSRGNQHNYSSRISDHTITRYARAARRHHALLILDIQPGRGRFLADARALRRWLRLPYVGLGLDPEWKLYGNQLPLSRIGHTGARSINAVSRWLERLTVAHRLPQKLLLVHEFTDDMVRDKRALRNRRHLAMVFNVDGFGSRAAKLGKYADFARGHRFPLGFKLFYDWDVNLLSPAQVRHLRPRPAVVEYE